MNNQFCPKCGSLMFFSELSGEFCFRCDGEIVDPKENDGRVPCSNENEVSGARFATYDIDPEESPWTELIGRAPRCVGFYNEEHNNTNDTILHYRFQKLIIEQRISDKSIGTDEGLDKIIEINEKIKELENVR